MQTRLRLTTLLTSLLLAILCSAQAKFFPDELMVSASALNLREKPEKTGKVVEKMPRGSTLQFVESVNGGEFVESDFVQISNYQLHVLEMQSEGPAIKQNLSHWFKTQEGMNPSVSLVWFGDLDGDHKPDAVIQDSPEEMGARLSLFLSSKAQNGAFLHKVCEHQLSID